MKRANIIISALTFLIVASIILATQSVKAQDNFGPVPSVVEKITPNTKCGERGVGRNVEGYPVEYQEPGARVNEAGRWERCVMPVVNPPQPDNPDRCQLPGVVEWQNEDNVCRAFTNGVFIDGGKSVLLRPNAGITDGVAGMSCHRGRLTTDFSVCSKVNACVHSSRRMSDDGGKTWWSWSGRLPEGEEDFATGPDGAKRRVICLGGLVRLQ